jgi:hypothetical protein
MSVIKNLVAVPNRIEAIYRRLLQVGERGEARETLLAYLNPPALQQKRATGDEENETSSPKTTIGEEVLREAFLLGIVEEHTQQDANRLKLAEPLRRGDITLRDYLEEVLLVPERASMSGQASFPTVMSWFLMQDCSQPLDFSRMPAQDIRELFGGERFELTNNANTQDFYYWARYLGFAWWIEIKDKKGVYPDPTNFLERQLRVLLADRGEVRLQDVMSSLARRYPIFEGGAIREEVEELISPQHRRLSHELSTSTSLALRRLERKNIIRLMNVADAPKMTLLTWPQSSQASHISYVGKEAS